MKKGWPTSMLADVCDVFADGDWVESKDQSPEGIRLIQTGNVGQGVFKDRGEKARYVSEATFTRLRCTEIFEGDCLISRLPDPVGRSCLLPDTGERMITAVDCTVVRFNRKQLLPEFFNFYSQSLDYLRAVDAETTGTTRKRISRSKLGRVTIPVPPLPEQQRIVGILDEAFGGIATTKASDQRNLQNARALFESHLHSIFSNRGKGWKMEKLGDLFDITSSKRVFESDWKREGVPFYRAREIVKLAQQGFVDNELFISEEMFSRYSTKYGIPAVGDIMVTGVGTLGICYVVKKDDRFYFKDGNIIWLKKKTEANSRFVEYAFRSEFLRTQIDDSVGATVGTYTIIKAKNTLVPLPSPSEQHRVVEQLDSLREETHSLASAYERKLTALESLKKSLLHQAFSGQL
jgi:type I restriction enzyme S subunit